MKELNVKVGDKVLYHWSRLFRNVEKIVKITQVAPTGRVRIDYNNDVFDKFGKMIGNSNGGAICYITVPTEEDVEKATALETISKLTMSTLTYEQAVKINEIFGKPEE